MVKRRNDVGFQVAVGARLGELRLALGMTWKELAFHLGYDNSNTLLQANKGRTCLSAEKLARLAHLHPPDNLAQVNINWLLTGLGQPLLSELPHFSSLGDRVMSAPLGVRRKIAAFLELEELHA